METLVQKLRARTGLLNMAEVSDLLGFHPVTLRDWAREGRLPTVRIGSAWRFDPVELAMWVLGSLMTKANKLTRPWGGPGTRTQIAVAGIATNFSWNFNPENNEWEIVKAMPEGTDDEVMYSSPSKADVERVLRSLIEKIGR